MQIGKWERQGIGTESSELIGLTIYQILYLLQIQQCPRMDNLVTPRCDKYD